MGLFRSLSLLAGVTAIGVGVVVSTSDLLGNHADLHILSLLRNNRITNRVSQQLHDYLHRSDEKLTQQGHVQDSAMVDLYYNLATDFYEYGWSQSFHFAPRLISETHEQSLIRHELALAGHIGITPNSTVLDVGCGVGGPARTIGRSTSSFVTGITLNEYQVERGRHHTSVAGLSDRVSLLQMDFTKMSLDSSTFDFAYAIEATCHATDLYDVYSEVARVLKHGGVFASYEWLSTPQYNQTDEQHAAILRNIEIGSGLPPMHTREDVLRAAQKAGFRVRYDEDVAIVSSSLSSSSASNQLPWWYKLDISGWSRALTHALTWTMETVGLAPTGSTATHAVLLKAADGLVAGGKAGIFTPMHLFVFDKPTDRKSVV